jgi:predicted NBD/HSP70 family sugar kinase
VANVINTFDPEEVVTGGGAAQAGNLLLEPAKRVAAGYVLPGLGGRTTIRFGFVPPEFNNNGTPTEAPEELEIAITPGEIAKPVLARVIGALAARAELSVDRLADTVLLGDAVSSSEGVDFAEGRLGISIKDGDGTLHLRVGPLIEGAGQKLIDDMELPGAGSLRSLASKMEVTKGETAEGQAAEFLVLEVA